MMRVGGRVGNGKLHEAGDQTDALLRFAWSGKAEPGSSFQQLLHYLIIAWSFRRETAWGSPTSVRLWA